MHVVIVGGGINGLLTAYELAHAGQTVTLVEADALARQASWAGGGIVSPLYPWRYSPAVTALAEWAQNAYPELCQTLFESTGIDPEFERSGMLYLDPPDLRDAVAWARAQQCRHELVPAPELPQRWPELAEDVVTGLWLPDIAHVRNPRLLQALIRHLQCMPTVSLQSHTMVDAVLGAKGIELASVVLANGERLFADRVVVCAGAWSAQLLPKTSVSIEPVRGQMLQFGGESNELSCMIMRDGHYLIPRRDGLVLCGSTLEHAGFNTQVTDEAREQLQRAAARMVPRFKRKQVLRHWAGLRPGTANGIPYIGPVPGHENVWVNAGQYRNGLVLAPASARLLRELLLGQTPFTAPEPYGVLC